MKNKINSILLNGIVILNFTGNPFIQLKDGKIKPKLIENLKLESDTYIRTHQNDYVVVKINNQYQTTVLPNSIFTIDGIRLKDDFKVRSIYLRRGQVHILEQTQDVKKNKIKSNDLTEVKISSSDLTPIEIEDPLKIESDFFSILEKNDQKISLYFSVDLKQALLEVCNYSSDFKLELFNHEMPQVLKNNEGVKFQGQLNKSGKIAYDLLLEKRKIPKGKWLSREKCSISQVKEIQDQVEKFYLNEKQNKEKERLAKIADKKSKDSRFLCHEPYGNLDQCHFILRQNKCIRERCNAEGKWTDSTEIGIIKNLCSAQGDVRSCGY